ncbi:hypothetical protein G8759_20100 [Spirosoma aureum]|uniref:Uncharacterized protein n=1 Tax=Spirosoma aureum TaxID=2692134 RepID=A0A6G9AR49_9BACT|nr:hypothetical protein [Spirosoma aureum]QIP14755.1 hypothetical protein G8759_20100 [Spirosoma aureum]
MSSTSNYIEVINVGGTSPADFKAGELRFYLYDKPVPPKTEQQAEAEAKARYLGLSPDEKATKTQPNRPVAPADNTYELAATMGDVRVILDPDYVIVDPDPTTGDGFDPSYSYTQSGQDAFGNTFISTPAPRLTAVTQLKPRLTGNNYVFTAQTALNTVLPKRLPTFTVHEKKVIGYPGALYTDWDNVADIIGRGYTHVTESAKPVDVDNYPTTLRRMIEGSFYSLAKDAADSLSPGDPKKQQLLDWAGPQQPDGSFEGPHLIITDPDSGRYYGRQWWILFRDNPGWRGAGIDFFSVNFEHMTPRDGIGFNAHQQQYRMVGWVTEGCIAAAALDGKTLRSGYSGEFGNLTTYAPWFYDLPATHDRNGNPLAEPNAGIPQYMHYSTLDEPYQGSSLTAPLGENSVLATLVKTGKAHFGVGRYLQHTMDGQTYFQKNGSAFVLDGDGNPLWRTDERTTTITGQSCTIYIDDYFMSMMKLYGIVAQFCSNMDYMAGGKRLPLSTDRQPGWEAMRGQVSQFRLDGEGESGSPRPDAPALNERPLSPDMVEGYALLMYLFAEYLRGWMRSQQPQDLGEDNDYGSKARASAEIYAKGFQRGANLNWIHDTSWQLLQPKFWIFKQGINGPADPDEHFARKPIILGGLAEKDGHPAMWLFAWWPCQDVDRVTDVKIWINKGNGPVTGTYVARMAGRKPFLDYWQLPDAAAGATPKDVYNQFPSLTDQLITQRMDYRTAKITNHPTPPPAA